MARMTEARRVQHANELEALTFFETMMSSLPDPRRSQGIRYPLTVVVTIALMAIVCGAEDAQAMEDWGNIHQDWLSNILEMPHGPPSQDVFLAIFSCLEPAHFSEVLRAWASLLVLRLKNDGFEKKHVAIDGKTSRRSFDKGKDLSPIHTVSAWASEMGIVLGEIKTAEKSNEITAIPELLSLLDISGTTITIDAMGCQTEISSTIIKNGGEYLLAVKGNQPQLHHDLETAFDFIDSSKESPLEDLLPPGIEFHQDIEKSHGRIVRRSIELSRDLSWLTAAEKWPGLNFYARVTRERTILRSGKTSIETSYYIGSDTETDARKTSILIRRHWSIENELHWVLDMAFREDEARHRAGNTADNMAILRHFALNIIKQDKTRKVGVANSRKKAGWNKGYLIKLLTESVV